MGYSACRHYCSSRTSRSKGGVMSWEGIRRMWALTQLHTGDNLMLPFTSYQLSPYQSGADLVVSHVNPRFVCQFVPQLLNVWQWSIEDKQWKNNMLLSQVHPSHLWSNLFPNQAESTRQSACWCLPTSRHNYHACMKWKRILLLFLSVICYYVTVKKKSLCE